MYRFFFFILLGTLPFFLDAQESYRITPETIAGSMTKTLQGNLGLDKSQLGPVSEINARYVSELIELRSQAAGVTHSTTFEQLVADWEQALQETLTLAQYREFRDLKERLVLEMQIAGLDSRTARLVQELQLREDQIFEVLELQAEFDPQVRQIRQGGDPEGIKMRRLRSLNYEQEEKLKNFLTEDQLLRYQELKAAPSGSN